MPIYEYLCRKCGHDFEKLMPMGAPTPGECPECGESGSINKKVSRSSVKFVGQGWYVTDYAKKKPIESPASSESKSSDKSSDTSSDTKKSDSPSKTSSESKPASDTKKSAKK